MNPWAALRAVVIFIYVFMLGPILITAAVSFNESNRSLFPPRGFSLRWWGRALSPNVELAAASLGASRWRTLWHVVFPLAKSGIIAGAVFAFVHSFTDVNLSLFLVRPGEQPITVKILGFLEYGFAPTLAAVSVITLALPLVLVAIVERVSGLGDFIYASRSRG